jgi:hypothetical protein
VEVLGRYIGVVTALFFCAGARNNKSNIAITGLIDFAQTEIVLAHLTSPVGGGVEEEPPDYPLEVKHEHDNSRSIEPHVPVAGDILSGDKRQLRSKSHEQ